MNIVDVHRPGIKTRQRQQDAETALAALIRLLDRKGREHPAAKALARKLDACRLGARCGSGGCPVCTQVMQERYADGLKRFLRGKTNIVCVTIVPQETLPRGKLATFNPTNFARRLKYRLTKAGVRGFLGGIDLSLNMPLRHPEEARWVPHAHGFTVIRDLAKTKQAIKEAFPATRDRKKPTRLQPWDGNRKACRYFGVKGQVHRRITLEARRFDPRTGEQRTCQTTRQERLSPDERVELALALDRWGHRARILSRFAQVRWTRDDLVIL